jgi:hypothetical protein
LDPNTNMKTAVSTHYYGVMGPSVRANPSKIVISGKTYSYTVGDSTNNQAWSYHGILSHYRETTGSVSSFRVVRVADIIDGTSGTLMLGEISVQLPAGQTNQYRAWTRGNSGGSGATKNVTYTINSTYYNGSNNFNDISFGSEHPGGCQFALGDASVRFLSQTIDRSVYQGLSSMNGAEAVALP